MNCRRRLVKGFAGVQDAARLPVYPEFVRPLDDVAERVMARVAVPSAAGPWFPIQEADADLSSRQIGERLRQEYTGASGCGLRRGRCNKFRRPPRCDGRQNGSHNGNRAIRHN